MYCLLQIFQVARGQLCIGAFGSEEVQCRSLLIFTISHNISDGKRISFPLIYYVYSLVQETNFQVVCHFFVAVLYNLR